MINDYYTCLPKYFFNLVISNSAFLTKQVLLAFDCACMCISAGFVSRAIDTDVYKSRNGRAKTTLIINVQYQMDELIAGWIPFRSTYMSEYDISKSCFTCKYRVNFQ